MYHFLLPAARCIFIQNVFFYGLLGRDARPLALEEVIGGGETRECGALDLCFSEGVSGEEEGWLFGGDEARSRMGSRNPAIAPAGEGGFGGPGGEVGGQSFPGEREERDREACFAGLEMRPAPQIGRAHV